MSAIVDIAEAVMAEINSSGVLPDGVSAQRHYVPTFEFKDMDTLHVSVVPRAVTIEPLARSYHQHDVQIDIGIQQRFAAADDPRDELPQIDGLMQVVEQISDLLRGKRLNQLPNVLWVRVQNDPVYAPEHIDQLRQFTSVLAVTYRTTRPGTATP